MASIEGKAHAASLADAASCRACGAGGALAVVGAVPATHPGPFSRGEWRLLHCGRCDVVYLDPLPTPDDLATLYQHSVQFADETYTNPSRVDQLLAYYGDAVDVHGLLPEPGQQVLEVGAGLAWIARVCKAREPRVHTVAQDVTGECVPQCAWVDEYLVGPLDAIPSERRFALISLTHVIEHLADPADTIAELAKRLVPGGRLFVTAPFRPAGWQRRAGIAPWLAYSYLHVPAHISYLSGTWYRNVAARCDLTLRSWCEGHDGGQAYEAVLEKPGGAPRRPAQRTRLQALRRIALRAPAPLREAARALWRLIRPSTTRRRS